MADKTIVAQRPKCDFCDKEALYDAKVPGMGWAYHCKYHFSIHGCSLGTGKGQLLVVKEANHDN